MKKEIALIAVMTLAPLAAPAQIQGSPAAAATEEIGHNAENLYDWARIGDWNKARTDLAALKSAVAKLQATGSTDLGETNRRLAAIQAAVNRRQPRALMHAANEMTRVAAELSVPFNPQVPPEVTLLDYDARAVTLWAEEGKRARLNESRMRLREDWATARPLVIAKGGITQAQQFEALIDRLSAAKTPQDFSAATTLILDSVDSLEAVFTRGSV